MFSKSFLTMSWVMPVALLLCNCGVNSPLKVSSQGKKAQALSADNSTYNFENGLDGWSAQTGGGCTNCSATWVGSGQGQTELAPTFLGTGSLKWYVDNGAGSSGDYTSLELDNPSVTINPNQLLSFAVWLPAGASNWLYSVSAYIKQAPDYSSYTRFEAVPQALTDDGWNQIYLQVPSNYGGVIALGVSLYQNSSFQGNVYLDSVNVVSE